MLHSAILSSIMLIKLILPVLMKTTETYFGFYQHIHFDNLFLSYLHASQYRIQCSYQGNFKHFLHKTNKENDLWSKFHFRWAANQIKTWRLVMASLELMVLYIHLSFLTYIPPWHVFQMISHLRKYLNDHITR